ncbi:MAG: hypothetical protein GKR94_21890 [Gammaproteobacteria bacterium]|nr:hypothetical protein [Gammaproteobacteria bacterium]
MRAAHDKRSALRGCILGTAVAAAMADGANPPAFHLLLRLPRNVRFFAVVLSHGLRRLLPPY